MTTINEMKLSMAKAIEETQLDLNNRQKQIARTALKILQDITPVKTGRLRANWNVGIATPDISTDYNRYDPNKSSKETYQRGDNIISQARLGDHIYISNTIDYAIKIERNGSKKAPAGMIQPTTAMLGAGQGAFAEILSGITTEIDQKVR